MGELFFFLLGFGLCAVGCWIAAMLGELGELGELAEGLPDE
jgi:hypothetical protein